MLDSLRRNWGFIKTAPWAAAFLVSASAGLTWAAATIFFGERAELLEAQRDSARSDLARLAGATGAVSTMPLSRPAIFEFLLETVLDQASRPVARNFTVRINNRSRDYPIGATLSSLDVKLKGQTIASVRGHEYQLIDPESHREQTFSLGDAAIPRDADRVLFDLEASYDTVPSTGVRRSIHRCELPLVWSDPDRAPPSPTNPKCRREEP